MPSFREAHAWLRGYSDALAGKTDEAGARLYSHDQGLTKAYIRGFMIGRPS